MGGQPSEIQCQNFNLGLSKVAQNLRVDMQVYLGRDCSKVYLVVSSTFYESVVKGVISQPP